MPISTYIAILSEREKMVEPGLAKKVYDEHELFLAGKSIFLLPSIEKIESGLRVSGTPINCKLPLFSIDVYSNRKVVAHIKGKGIPSKYKSEIERIVAKNFC